MRRACLFPLRTFADFARCSSIRRSGAPMDFNKPQVPQKIEPRARRTEAILTLPSPSGAEREGTDLGGSNLCRRAWRARSYGVIFSLWFQLAFQACDRDALDE